MLIADASPLIGFARIDELSLLERIFDEVVVPAAVWDEVVLRAPGKPGARRVRAAKFLVVEHAESSAVERMMNTFGLGPGESEALALALAMPNVMLLVDDKAARRAALGLGLERIGSAGVLVQAKRAGIIDRVRPRLEALVASGAHIAPAVVVRALREAGEAGG